MDAIHKTNLTLAAASKLSHSQLLTFPAPTLSALFLSLLNAAGKHQQDKQSVFEIVMSVSQQPVEVLASAIRFLSTIQQRDLRKIPAIDLSQASILNWLINARAAAAAPVLASSFGSSTIPKQKPKGILHKSLLQETRTEAKNLLGFLIEDGLLPSKVVGLFRNSLKGENLVYTNDALRADLIAYLSSINNINAAKLIAIYKECATNRTAQERIVLQQLDSEAENASDSFTNSAALAIKKMSIAETIAYRKEQLAREKARKETKQTPEELKAMIFDVAEELAKQACQGTTAQMQAQQEDQSKQEQEQDKQSLDFTELDFASLSFGSDYEDQNENKNEGSGDDLPD